MRCTQERRGVLPWLLAIVALAATLQGCAGQAALCQRPSGAVVGPGVFRVPPGWDYRQDWRVPEQRLAGVVKGYLGTPYHYGGTGRSGVDCSGLVFLVFRDLAHARLPRTTQGLRRLGDVVGGEGASAGDLVFFATSGLRVNHVGICLDSASFAHASTSHGVMVSNLADNYWRERRVFIRRVF